jgi:hypothetical protein
MKIIGHFSHFWHGFFCGYFGTNLSAVENNILA